MSDERITLTLALVRGETGKYGTQHCSLLLGDVELTSSWLAVDATDDQAARSLLHNFAYKSAMGITG